MRLVNLFTVKGQCAKVSFAQADRRYLHACLQNLAGNATRYAQAPLSSQRGLEKMRPLSVMEDDGRGIPEKTVKSLYPVCASG